MSQSVATIYEQKGSKRYNIRRCILIQFERTVKLEMTFALAAHGKWIVMWEDWWLIPSGRGFQRDVLYERCRQELVGWKEWMDWSMWFPSSGTGTLSLALLVQFRCWQFQTVSDFLFKEKRRRRENIIKFAGGYRQNVTNASFYLRRCTSYDEAGASWGNNETIPLYKQLPCEIKMKFLWMLKGASADIKRKACTLENISHV